MSGSSKLAVLFADICGSTSMYDTLGDGLARRLIASCIALMVEEVTAQHGVLIKTIGDEIMCSFPTAESAFKAACAMQNRVKNNRFENGTVIRVRIGFHFGEVICEGNDVFGDTVNVAARIASLAKADKILTSQNVVDSLPRMLQYKTQPIMSAELKGKQEETAIFMVEWQEDEERTRISFVPAMRKPEAVHELTLSYANHTYKVNKDRKSLVVGRGDSCDIVVPCNFASRQHARFELRAGKFSIVDQSTNGSYVRSEQGNVTHITNQEMILQNSGAISLGQKFSDKPTELIVFSVSM